MKRLHLMLVTVTAAAALAAGLSTASAESQSIARAATVKTAASPLGRILVDARSRTLYLFERDSRGHSACAGECAAYWPPLLAHGRPQAGRGAKQALLGVTRRADGSSQVTYAGHPLYRFAQDTKTGQTNGQGLQDFGGGWYVLSPAGKKIERAAS